VAKESSSLKNALPAHQPKWAEKLAGRTVAMMAKSLAATIRFDFEDPHRSVLQQPAIFCIWHNRLALCLEIFRRYIVHHGDQRRLAALVSASRDGAMLSVVLRAYGVEPVRGSSSRRGFQAMKGLITHLKKGADLALTPDGPRGPRYQAHEGVITLSQLTQVPIIPVSYRLSSFTALSTWDEFMLPHPMARCTVRFGKTLHIDRQLKELDRQEAAKALGHEMNLLGEE
jgi:lysophospholipid acyltransferase (LPLAT)-like uncharacterized protein